MKIKICGLQQQKDVATAVTAGVDYIGFVFTESSRQVSLAQAHELAKEIPTSVKTVGVFVDPSLAEVQEAIATVPLDLVQLHGQESPSFVKKLKVPVIKAVRVTPSGLVPDITSYPSTVTFLLDTPGIRYKGGSGQTFDWQLIKPQNLPMERFFIAGGLTSENVQQTMAYFAPYGVDVSSGVETAGQKDQEKIKQFIAEARGESKNDL